jgi:peptidoglycan/LPS O-acetylase OafA/YrhL
MIGNQFENNKRIFGLDLMRATAITMVLCSHVLWIYPDNSSIIAQLFTVFGFFGVEIFFVLSGFLIGRILFKVFVTSDYNLKSVFHFLKRRWYRTLPNYFLFLVVAILIGYFTGMDLSKTGRYFVFLQNFATTMLPFYPETWSLSIEEFTYLITPFALLLGLKLFTSSNPSRLFLGTIIFLIAFFLFTKIYYCYTTTNTTVDQWNLSLKGVVIYRIDSILIGVVASWIYMTHYPFWKKNKINFAFLGCLLFGLLVLSIPFFKNGITIYPFFWNVLFLPITSITFALFLPFLTEWEKSFRWISKPIVFISKISYAVYLLHYSIILYLMKYCINTSAYSIWQLHLFTFVYLLITLLLSGLLYRYYEKPMMELRDKN